MLPSGSAASAQTLSAPLHPGTLSPRRCDQYSTSLHELAAEKEPFIGTRATPFIYELTHRSPQASNAIAVTKSRPPHSACCVSLLRLTQRRRPSGLGTSTS